VGQKHRSEQDEPKNKDKVTSNKMLCETYHEEMLCETYHEESFPVFVSVVIGSIFPSV
jgi:hypothetical protein